MCFLMRITNGTGSLLDSQGAVPSSVSSRLEHALQSMIAEGRLSGGERLPTVRELTRHFATSRTTVLAAIRGLESKGLVRSIPRQGTVVLARPGIADKLKRKKVNQIGVIDLLSRYRFYNEDVTSWYQGVERGAEYALSHSNYHLVKAVFPNDSFWMRRLWERIDDLAASMAGVMLHTDIATDEILNGLDSRSIPWVTIGRRSLRSMHNFVAVDHISTGQLVGWVFARLGFRRVLYLGWDRREYFLSAGLTPGPDEKFMGLVQGYVEGGGDSSCVSNILCVQLSADEGYRITKQFIAQRGMPDAIFSYSDHLAIGGMRALQEHGVRIPEQAGVVGSIGFSSCECSTPSLTVASQPIREIGRQLAQLLLEMIRGSVTRVSGRVLASEWIFRQSLAIPDSIKAELDKRISDQRDLCMKVGL